MSVRRGAALTVPVTLGHSDRSDLGPTTGNDFFTRWPDDLALLSDAGVTDLRITFDWARFQPRPGEFDGSWAERYQQFVDATRAIGMRVWAALHDNGVPRWFANEGGIDDDEALNRWWPRWVERVADEFGDSVDGWVPFSVMPDQVSRTVWSDTWSVLGGGPSPVVLSRRAVALDALSALPLDELDMFGIALEPDIAPDADATDDTLRIAAEMWEHRVGQARDLASDATVIVSQFSPHHDDRDTSGRLVEQLVNVIDAANATGEASTMCFIDPAIEGPDSPGGLFDAARAPLPSADAYFAHAAD